MRIDVLTISDCPNGPLAAERVCAAVLEANVDRVTVVGHIVDGGAEAEELGMHGSPTFLFDGVDPFAEVGSVPSMSCRLFRTEAGLQGCPSVADLVEVIRSRG